VSKVIVFGSLNMDLSVECEKVPDAGETVCGSGFLMSPGGKGANQAYAAARMGAETYWSVPWAMTRLARSCEVARLRRCPLRLPACARHAPKGTATIVRCHGDNRIVVDAGANAALTSDEVCAALDDRAEPGDVSSHSSCDFPTRRWDALAYAARGPLHHAQRSSGGWW